MNEYYRTGKGDEYIEVSLDWESIDENKYSQVLWWLREAIAGDKYDDPKLAKVMREVADTISPKKDDK